MKKLSTMPFVAGKTIVEGVKMDISRHVDVAARALYKKAHEEAGGVEIDWEVVPALTKFHLREHVTPIVYALQQEELLKSPFDELFEELEETL